MVDALRAVSERLRDVKRPVRREAAARLAAVFRHGRPFASAVSTGRVSLCVYHMQLLRDPHCAPFSRTRCMVAASMQPYVTQGFKPQGLLQGPLVGNDAEAVCLAVFLERLPLGLLCCVS